jgi:hypothetical protein
MRTGGTTQLPSAHHLFTGERVINIKTSTVKNSNYKRKTLSQNEKGFALIKLC